jgi:tetratricopeptide (TPR) repeat protein
MHELRLLFSPADNGSFTVTLEPAGVPVPLTPFLTDDDYENLRWYLEDYMDLPDGGAVIRAQGVEQQIHSWGTRLHDAVFSAPENAALLAQLLASPEPRELTIATDHIALLRLPWELMADAAGNLAQRLSVRRQLATPQTLIPREVSLPLRMLYIVSRPGDTGFIDPRLTTRALFDALDPLQGHVRLDFCRPPTLPQMEEMLRAAQAAGDPYDLVHFDGHGTFLPESQIGALCFEKPDDGSGDSRTDLVPADRLGDLLAQYSIPLVVLEACRSATVGKTAVFRSVAPRLIRAGVASVLSMGHAVHVEAARILLDRFYRELARGTTIGHAVAQARTALRGSPARWVESGPGGKTITLHDWFLPHLYQRGLDEPLLPPGLANQQPVRRYDIFLSHNHADSVRVESLVRILTEKHGLRVWLDKWECGPGALEPQCEAGIRDSRFTVVVGSQAALNSKWVRWEIDKHNELNPDGDRLLPVKFEKLTLPPDLHGLLWVDFTSRRKDAENAALLASLIRSADAADARRTRGFRLPPEQGQPGAFPRPPQFQFQGRARELYDLERAFRRHRGIVLHAMGGMGKTTLASEAAQWWTRSGLFRDGACFVSFERTVLTADRIITALGEYCEGPRFHQRPATEQRRRAIEFLRDHAVLMVWDNYESALPQFTTSPLARSEKLEAGSSPLDCGSPLPLSEGPEAGARSGGDVPPAAESATPSPPPAPRQSQSGRGLPQSKSPSTSPSSSDSPYTDAIRAELASLFHDLTTGPGKGGILVTCRPGETGLGRGAFKFELHGLARADSLWLLHRILERDGASLSDPRLTRDQLDPLLRDLADHPLSLELVGPHLRTLTPAAIRADFARLVETLSQDSDQTRNTSLHASLEFSRRHLSPAARAALPWLGLFSGGVFEQPFLDISQLTPEAWSPIRQELEGIALLRPEDDIQIGGRPFLRFHPTLAIASAEASLAENPQTRERFVHVYLALMQALDKALTGSQSRAALAILDREEMNYRTAVRWAIADGHLRFATDLGDTFSTYLQMSGRLRERDAWLNMLKEATRSGAFTSEAAKYERQEAWTRFQQGDPRGGVAQLQALIERLRLTTAFDPEEQLAWAVGDLGKMLHHAGVLSEAIILLQESINLWEALVVKAAGKPWKLVLTSVDNALARAELGNLSMVMGNLANALASLGRHTEALVVAENALQIDERNGYHRDIAAGHGQCASILMAEGRYDEADARYELALAAAVQAGDKELEGSLLQHEGSLAVMRNQLDRASRLYQKALQRFQEASAKGSIMRTYNSLGVTELKAGRLPEARAWYEKSRALAVELQDQPGLGQAAQNIGIVCQLEGEAARAQGDEAAARRHFDTARRSVEESLAVWKSQQNQPDEAGSLGQLARIHLLLGDLDTAARYAHAAREIHESLGLKEVNITYHILSEIAAARGDTAAAAEWEQKRDALIAELEERAGGGSGIPAQMLQAFAQLTLACARAGFGDSPLGPDAEEALATLDGYPAPFPDFTAHLRYLAAGEFCPIPPGLPKELHDLLSEIHTAIRDQTGQ